MRLLFEMDLRDYDANDKVYVRNSARGILLRGGRVAMVYSEKYGYYKFPGGGIEDGESAQDALIREVLEEAGLAVIPASIREYGVVHRAQRSTQEDACVFVQDNFYYLCQAEEGVRAQALDAYEEDASFALEWVTPQRAIACNRQVRQRPFVQTMLEREARVLELLTAEGYFK